MNSARRARAVARTLQSAATSAVGVENNELVEVADVLASEVDKIIAAQQVIYKATCNPRKRTSSRSKNCV